MLQNNFLAKNILILDCGAAPRWGYCSLIPPCASAWHRYSIQLVLSYRLKAYIKGKEEVRLLNFENQY